MIHSYYSTYHSSVIERVLPRTGILGDRCVGKCKGCDLHMAWTTTHQEGIKKCVTYEESTSH